MSKKTAKKKAKKKPAKKKPARKKTTTQRARAKTKAQQAAFLKAYSQAGVITTAAEIAKIDRKRHYVWLDEVEKYPDYAERFKDAHEQACDRLEAEAVRRGHEGWEEPVYGKQPGQHAGTGVVGTIRKYSDRMLELMLKSRRPVQFRERLSAELTGGGGGPIEQKVVFYIPSNRRDDGDSS
jgi:hypothetical protein